jgi:hypothetical protein
MDADVMITIAFCLEVVLFALAAGLFIAHELRKSRTQAAAEARTESRPVASAKPVAAGGTRPKARAGRAVGGLHA